VRTTEEDEYFPLPRNLRDLANALDTVATLAVGGMPTQQATVSDRHISASDVLAALS
jgi:4-hydroxy-3-methylbut-2-enyl diphosphate reductase